MKNSFTCVKCASHNVVEVKGWNVNQYSKIPLTKWSVKSAVVDRYVCMDCGYTEEYVQLTDKVLDWGNKMFDEQGGGDGFV